MVGVNILRSSLGPLRLPDGELRDLADALQSPPRAAIRVRPGLGPDALPFPLERAGWHPRGYFVSAGVRPASYLQFAAGDYYIQDAASLLAMAVLDARDGERVCDLCAAPGGKATAILESIGEAGWLLANEAIGSRIAALNFNLARARAIADYMQNLARLEQLVGGSLNTENMNTQ